jgi:bacterioferritin-associated ferredoxin
MGAKKKTEIVCRCNNISRETIETAIRDGAQTMNEIFDLTTAGVGPCGGTCRRKLGPLLDHYLQTGTFPEKLVEDLTGKVPAPKKDSEES